MKVAELLVQALLPKLLSEYIHKKTKIIILLHRYDSSNVSDNRPVAQLAERRSPKPKVGGSMPSWPAI